MRIGVVGCGLAAGYHIPYILRQKNVDGVSVTDLNVRKAERIAKRYGIDAYPNFQTLLNSQCPDVVHILTPPGTHAELSIRAMEAGCHVLVEKPMALTVEEADAMIAAARRSEVKLCIDHSRLWAPLIMRARKLVEEGKIGRVLHVDVNYSFDINSIDTVDAHSNDKMAWLQRLPGGLLFDMMPHAVSILLYFIKEPLKISAKGMSNGIMPGGLPDELRALLSTTNVTGCLSISLGMKPDGMTIRIYGTKMSIHVNFPNMTMITQKQRHVPRKILRALENIEQAIQLVSCTFVNGFKVAVGKMHPPDGIASVIEKFYESIETNVEPPITGENGRAVVKVCTEILEQIDKS
jgi:predicted dehydrogenase